MPSISECILEPLGGYQAAFMDATGNVVGFGKVDIVDGSGGAQINAASSRQYKKALLVATSRQNSNCRCGQRRVLKIACQPGAGSGRMRSPALAFRVGR